MQQTTGFGDPGASFTYTFSTLGASVGSISFDLMQLANNPRSTTWSIEYGLGASPAAFTLLSTWDDPGAWGATSTNFTTANFGASLDNQTNVVFRVTALTGSTGSGARDPIAIDNFVINTAAFGSGTLGIEDAGSAVFSGDVTAINLATLTATTNAMATFSGVISGAGTVNKTGAGTATLAGTSANTFTNTTTVSAGVLQLNKTDGVNALVGAVTINSGATLLVSTSNQVADDSVVTLSGGTLTRGNGVSETFGDLTLTANSFLDFGSTPEDKFFKFGALTLDSYTLGVSNFLLGNKFQYTAADFAAGQALANTFSFTSSANRDCSFSGGIFTITAIPEPSAIVAAFGLLILGLWSLGRSLTSLLKFIALFHNC